MRAYTMRSHLTPDEREEIVQRYIAGETPSEIGRAMGRNRTTVGWVVRAARDAGQDIPFQVRALNGPTPIDPETVCRLFLAGLPPSEISRRTKHPAEKIRAILHAAGIERRYEPVATPRVLTYPDLVAATTKLGKKLGKRRHQDFDLPSRGLPVYVPLPAQAAMTSSLNAAAGLGFSGRGA